MLELIPNLWTVVFETVNFLVVAFVLERFVFRPLMQRARSRSEERAEMLEEIREERAEAEALREELEARLEGAEEEAASIISRAQEQAEEERATLLQEAQAEAEHVLVEAHQDAQDVRRQAMREFHSELLDAILEISGMVIGQLAPDEMHDEMVRALSDRIWEMGRSEMERVETFRRSLGERTPTAHVTTAHPLTPEQQGLLARTFSALADRNVNLEVEVDPALAAGLRVRLGDIVVDNSVAGDLEELREDVAEVLEERMQRE
jgi:F-type H+-transporting ATPase subunit b